MIVTPASRDVAILANIVSTLQQIRPSTKAMESISVPVGTTSIIVYVDSARTTLLYTDSSPTMTESGNRYWWTPSDTELNGATGLSTSLCQPLVYLTCQPSGTQLTYRNLDNLLFSAVSVATKDDPKFLPPGNVAFLLLKAARTIDRRTNDDLSQVLLDFSLNVRLNIPNWAGLSEQVRMTTFMATSNCIRLALMADRYRGGNATLYNADIDGTFVSELTPIESKDLMRGKMRIRSCYWTSPYSY